MRTARVIFFLSLSACCLRGVVAAVAAVFDLNPTLIWILKFVSEWRVCESVLVLVVAPAAVLLLLLMVLPAVVERMSLALSEACGSGWFGT